MGLNYRYLDGPFTLFAPIDEAFDKLAGKTLGKKEATQIVNKHLVSLLFSIVYVVCQLFVAPR